MQFDTPTPEIKTEKTIVMHDRNFETMENLDNQTATVIGDMTTIE